MTQQNQKTILIALGGNAISREGEEGNIPQQFEHTRESAAHLAKLVAEGWQPIITHGNGPQVGNMLSRVQLAASQIYTIPLHICVADTQAGMGYMITQCWNNAMHERGIKRHSATLITNVEVDPNHPAFSNPDKPVGRYVSELDAKQLEEKFNWLMKRFPKGDYRRVVPSPPPKRILEIELIKRLVSEGELLVVAGGGGIPVAQNDKGEFSGVDCVVDKDRVTALLGIELGIENLMIATGVEKIMLNYRKPDQHGIDQLTIQQARKHLRDGQFPSGTMRPKIESAIHFLENSPAKNPQVTITNLANLHNALQRKTGTCLLK